MYGLGGGHRVYTERGSVAQINGLPLSTSFLNGSPTSADAVCRAQLRGRTSSTRTWASSCRTSGVMNRFTVSAGLRFDWLRESIAASPPPAGPLQPARSFAVAHNVPNWKDINPRFGIVWDPAGDAKTAVKFGINRYVALGHDRYWRTCSIRPSCQQQHHAVRGRT